MLTSLSKAEKRSWKIFFLFRSCHKFNFRKKHILAVFRIIFQKKKDIISDVIISIAVILKIFFYHFFSNIVKHECAKSYVKSIFLSGFTQRGTLCAPPPHQGMIRQEQPVADRAKTKFRKQGLIWFHQWKVFLSIANRAQKLQKLLVVSKTFSCAYCVWT